MVKFDYFPDGHIAGVRDVFTAFNEPTVPISAEITALTGITDEIVAGHRIREVVDMRERALYGAELRH